MSHNTANAGSGETMSNEEFNALLIQTVPEQYIPVITEGKTKTIDADGKPVIVPITPEERIAEAATFVSNLVIKGPEDKENYKLARNVLAGVKKWRTGIEAKRKELKAVALEYGRKVDGEAKRLTELVTKVEAELTTKVDAIDKAIEEAKKAEQLRRHKLLTENGWQFTGAWYICAVYNYTPDQVNAWDDATLNDWVKVGQEEIARLEAERIRKEEEAKAQAEAARLQAEENARLAAEAAELKAKLAALEAAQQPKAPEPPVEQPKPQPPRMFQGHPRPQGFEVPAPQVPAPQPTAPAADPFKNIPAPTFTPPGVGSVTINDYEKGFEDCRAQVLAIMADATPRKRAEFVELFTNLKPTK